jgi:integrase
VALEWKDADLAKLLLCVQRPDWKAQVTTKGGRLRYVRMRNCLAMALKQHRHLKSPRVVHQDDGAPVTQKIVQTWVKRSATRASVRSGVHILRHTFCSHLAMRAAPARASGTRRAQGSFDHAAVHASESLVDRQRDSLAGLGAS